MLGPRSVSVSYSVTSRIALKFIELVADALTTITVHLPGPTPRGPASSITIWSLLDTKQVDCSGDTLRSLVQMRRRRGKLDLRAEGGAGRHQLSNKVTARGTNSDVTSALRPMAIPEKTPATSST